jgi:hypothetical protein
MPLLVEYEGFHFADVMQFGALLGDVGEPGFGLLQITGDRIALSEPVEGQQHRGDAPHVKLRRADLRGQRERFAQHADTLFVTLEVGQDGSFGRSCENGLRRVAAAVGRFDGLAGVFERLLLSGDRAVKGRDVCVQIGDCRKVVGVQGDVERLAVVVERPGTVVFHAVADPERAVYVEHEFGFAQLLGDFAGLREELDRPVGVALHQRRHGQVVEQHGPCGRTAVADLVESQPGVADRRIDRAVAVVFAQVGARFGQLLRVARGVVPQGAVTILQAVELGVCLGCGAEDARQQGHQ